MSKVWKRKIWLATEFTIAVCFYYVAYNIALVVFDGKEPWFETNIKFQIFCGTYILFYATFRFINFIMSWVKGRSDAFSDYFTADWFSVHKLFRKRKET